jgi:hypothetical protein
LLEQLKRLYAEAGQLSGVLIDQAPDMPSSATYRTRFGSLARAYEMIGYTPVSHIRVRESRGQGRSKLIFFLLFAPTELDNDRN